jgi:predicted ABC-type exoprotein transport system permease subunit
MDTLFTKHSDWYYRKQEAKAKRIIFWSTVVLVIVIVLYTAHLDYLLLEAGLIR